MDLEQRMQHLEAEMGALRARLDALVRSGTDSPGGPGPSGPGPSGPGLSSPGPSEKAPAEPAPGESGNAKVMRALAEQIREASKGIRGTEQPLVLQAMVDRPGSTWISISTMAELLEQVDAAAVVRLAGVLSSEARLRILKALAAGERSAAEAGAAAGLEGGPLYHHLSELQEGGFLTQPSRGRYAMTRRGRDLYYQMALLVRTPYDQPPRQA
jgi:DNA-binding transcriptional ArsR family regulator